MSNPNENQTWWADFVFGLPVMGVGVYLMVGSEWEPWWSLSRVMGAFVFFTSLTYILVNLNAPASMLRLFVFPMAGTYAILCIISAILAILGIIQLLSKL
ncbi:MAG: hypothetical protein JNJ70_17710 [Verrucomicrobiales bacterium]|nr:hypothetical protein [Verrucomicrobiales bacterium]